jgi:hypothetical protein
LANSTGGLDVRDEASKGYKTCGSVDTNQASNIFYVLSTKAPLMAVDVQVANVPHASLKEPPAYSVGDNDTGDAVAATAVPHRTVRGTSGEGAMRIATA